MKWILAVLALVVVGWFVHMQKDGVKTAYVNGLAEYNQLPGREYVFERYCYIFKFVDRSTAWPLVGANFPGNPDNISGLPAAVSSDAVGKVMGDVKILDIIHMGSRFKIVSVRRDQKHGEISISFEILFIDEADRRYPRLDAFWIMDHASDKRGVAPEILDSFAVPRIKK